MTTAADILKSKPNQAIFAIGPRASVYDALKLAADKGVGALLVMEDERVIGIVTERDYARKVALLSRSSKDTAVSAFSPPDSRVMFDTRLPGGRAMIATPVSSKSSPVNSK